MSTPVEERETKRTQRIDEAYSLYLDRHSSRNFQIDWLPFGLEYAEQYHYQGSAKEAFAKQFAQYAQFQLMLKYNAAIADASAFIETYKKMYRNKTAKLTVAYSMGREKGYSGATLNDFADRVLENTMKPRQPRTPVFYLVRILCGNDNVNHEYDSTEWELWGVQAVDGRQAKRFVVNEAESQGRHIEEVGKAYQPKVTHGPVWLA